MNNKQKIIELIGRLFFISIILFLAAGLTKALLLSDDINSYENRYADKFSAFSLASYIDGSFQDDAEAALGDQIVLSSTAKMLYNTLDFAAAKPAIALVGSDQSRYAYFRGNKFLGDNILYNYRNLGDLQEPISKKAENLNSIFAAHPELDFYVYYIEKDTDIDFLTGEKPGIYSFVREKLVLPAENVDAFEINNFDEFKCYFYKTDHHWNYKGSYRGYTELSSMLGFTPLQPIEERLFDARLSGSKAFGSKELLNEPFSAYNFDFPAMDIFINGEISNDYGALQQCFANGFSGITTYGDVYGSDYGFVTFDTHSDGENLLIIGESYDNAVIKLLASHFNQTFAVDLRYYEHNMGEPFRFASFVRGHDIDKVLLIGNVDYFTMEEFMLVDN